MVQYLEREGRARIYGAPSFFRGRRGIWGINPTTFIPICRQHTEWQNTNCIPLDGTSSPGSGGLAPRGTVRNHISRIFLVLQGGRYLPLELHQDVCLILRTVVGRLCTALLHYGTGCSCNQFWDRHGEVYHFCYVDAAN